MRRKKQRMIVRVWDLGAPVHGLSRHFGVRPGKVLRLVKRHAKRRLVPAHRQLVKGRLA